MSAAFDIREEIAAATREQLAPVIDKPGIYRMDADAYHADPCPAPSLSSSIAKIIIERSPLHAWHAHPRLNPHHQSEERADFDLGSAAHALLLEGEDRMSVIDADSYRAKAAQEQRDAARAAGRHPILKAKHVAVVAMAKIAERAIAGCPDLSGLTLADGDSERAVIWQECGIWLRCRPDWLARDLSAMLDYKTTGDAEPMHFGKHIARMLYHFQAAFYRRGVRAVTGVDVPFILLAQETEEPHACTFHGCAPSLAAIAEQMVDQAIRTWAGCMKAGTWPAYSPRIHYHDAAAWAAMEQEERMAGIPYEISKLWEKIA